MNQSKKKDIIKVIIMALIYIALYVLIKLKVYSSFSIDRLIILTSVYIFICMHFLIDLKKMYDFIYKYRYYIAAFLLAYVTVRGIHGSSIGMWNNFIQPNSIPSGSNPILGIARGIRSDEWMVGTPYILSQYQMGFSKVNTLMMGTGGLVTLFPSLPCLSITVIGKLFYIPYLILPASNALAFYWYGKLFALFLASFELFMILTNKKKLYSSLGAVLIAFSPANMWWYSIDVVLWGNIAIVLIYHFLRASKPLNRLLYSILIGIVGLNYIMLIYPAWQVPFGYVYAVILIWILMINKKFLDKKQLLYIPIIIGVILIILIPTLLESKDIFNLINNTSYPGKRFVYGGYLWQLLFTYLITPLYSFYNVVNPSEYSNFIGLYPIPFLIAIYQIIYTKIKGKKVDIILILFSILIVFISLWNYVSLPKWFLKISLLSYSIPERSQIVVGYICIFLIIHLLSNYERTIRVPKKTLIVSVVISLFFYVIGMLSLRKVISNYINIKVIISMAILFVPILSTLIINNKKYNKYLAISLILLTLITGGIVNPISKGLSVIYDKPFAKEIRKIVKNDSNGKWSVINANFIVSNYALANGAKIISSTNYYPNFELWKKIDPEKKYYDIYNRYAHVYFELSASETNFELKQSDMFVVKINIKDVCKLDINYAISSEELEKYNADNVIFETLYNEDGVVINSLTCK